MGAEELKSHIERIAEFGPDPVRGCSRVFGSPSLEECRQYVRSYFEECGMKAYIDPAGNVHGILSSGRKDSPEIFMGSHIDTVKQGGMFDGVLGVVAAAETARAIHDSGIPLTRDLHILATNGEEGNDLGGTFGSRAMAGILPLDDAEWCRKAETFGYTRDQLKKAVLDAGRAQCYLELHIEQGPTLYRRKEEIGVVTGIVGLRRFQVCVHGQSNHAGTTMMEDRNDALVTAAHLILLADRTARDIGHHFVATVGKLEVIPGSVAVIPGEVDFVLEMRNQDEKLMDEFLTRFRKEGAAFGDFDISPIVRKAPVQCDSHLQQVIEKVCRERQFRYRLMPSGATHDGNAMSVLMPVGMIFVPSVDGISHSPDEWTDWSDVQNGYQVLLDTVVSLEREA